MMHRTKTEEFLALLRRLRVPPDEMKMADNYFAILSNRVPETWFDQDFGLGGGHAFTVGSDGEERNKKHIVSTTLSRHLPPALIVCPTLYSSGRRSISNPLRNVELHRATSPS